MSLLFFLSSVHSWDLLQPLGSNKESVSGASEVSGDFNKNLHSLPSDRSSETQLLAGALIHNWLTGDLLKMEELCKTHLFLLLVFKKRLHILIILKQ